GLEYAAPSREASGEKLQWTLRHPRWKVQDRVFTVLLGLILAFNFMSIWWLKQVKFPPRNLNEMIDKRYAKLILEVPLQSRDLFPPVKKNLPEEKAPEEKAAQKSEKKSQSAPKPKDRGRGGLLGSLEAVGGIDGVLDNRALKDALHGVGVLTTKRP